jgi:ribA/ribD-fused uncharacterized protein
MKRIGNVTAFYSKHDMFSNFYPCEVLVHGIVFNCTEQVFMYTKAKYFKDEVKAQEILRAEYAWKQKQLGREVNGFNRAIWNRVSPHFMRLIVGEKLDQHANIRAALMKTDDTIIVEASDKDFFWGAGIGIDDPKIADSTQWPGRNELGKIFMWHRDKYRGKTK